MFTATETGSIVLNATTSDEPFSVRGAIEPGPTDAALTVNARVHVVPGDRASLVRTSLAERSTGGIEASIETPQAFQPGYLTPVPRFDRTVEDGGRPAESGPGPGCSCHSY